MEMETGKKNPAKDYEVSWPSVKHRGEFCLDKSSVHWVLTASLGTRWVRLEVACGAA